MEMIAYIAVVALTVISLALLAALCYTTRHRPNMDVDRAEKLAQIIVDARWAARADDRPETPPFIPPTQPKPTLDERTYEPDYDQAQAQADLEAAAGLQDKDLDDVTDGEGGQ